MRVSRVTPGNALDLTLTTAATTVTVDVVDDAGTALVTAGPAPVANGEAVYTLIAPDALDRLTVSWTADGAVVATDIVEVVGGFLFELADARKVKPFDNVDKWPDADLARLRTLVEQSIEDACNGQAFVPRYCREKVDGNGDAEVALSNASGLDVRSVSVDGAALDLTTVTVEATPEGTLLRTDGDVWSVGRRNIEVAYEHGFEFPPGRVPGAALKVLRQVAVDSPISDRAISFTNEDGTYQSFVVAGVRGAVFSVPEANAVVRQYRHPGFA